MTRSELAELTGVAPSHIDKLTSDRTIPTSCVRRDGRGGNSIAYAGAAVLIVELVLALEKLCGPSASLPKRLVRHLGPKLEAVWHDPARVGPITAEYEGATVTIPFSFVERAKELASVAQK